LDYEATYTEGCRAAILHNGATSVIRNLKCRAELLAEVRQDDTNGDPNNPKKPRQGTNAKHENKSWCEAEEAGHTHILRPSDWEEKAREHGPGRLVKARKEREMPIIFHQVVLAWLLQRRKRCRLDEENGDQHNHQTPNET
jgi:hypothetical protein